MRTPLIVGNWKMHGSYTFLRNLVRQLQTKITAFSDVEVAICPPFVYLSEAYSLLSGTRIALGAQNMHVGLQGAYTGEVAGVMLAEIGCRYVIIGHSERRILFHESLPFITAKCQSAIEAGLTPILCVGETQEQREAGETESVIAEQLKAVLDELGVSFFQQAVVAYEPVWAIGTGLTAKPEEAQSVHAFIRELISKNSVDIGMHLRILYGGSVKPDNAAMLFGMPDIDGGLIGGASLDAKQFSAICGAASEQVGLAQ